MCRYNIGREYVTVMRMRYLGFRIVHGSHQNNSAMPTGGDVNVPAHVLLYIVDCVIDNSRNRH